MYFSHQNKSVVDLMFAAYTGDVSALRRFALSGKDMELADYDQRTALHVAAAEGHEEVVLFLTEVCKVNPLVKDRWGNTPLDDALQFARDDMVKMLQDYQTQYTKTSTSPQTEDTLDPEEQHPDTLKGLI